MKTRLPEICDANPNRQLGEGGEEEPLPPSVTVNIVAPVYLNAEQIEAAIQKAMENQP